MPLKSQLSNLPPSPNKIRDWLWTRQIQSQAICIDNDWPRISIVTPSYMQGQYLEETIRSVLLQDYPNLEYIVIDGGSSDNSREIIEKYSPFFTYWTSEPDRGQTHAINKGFERSTGTIMGWVNSDDILLPGALYRVAQFFKQFPSTMIASGFRKFYDQNSQFLYNYMIGLPINENIRYYCCVAQESTFWRRELWEKVGTLDESFQFSMDYEYWLRVIHQGYVFGVIPYYIGGFRHYANNKSTTWRNVQEHNKRLLHERYGVPISLEELPGILGNSWARYYRFLSVIRLHPISNYPRVLLWIERWLKPSFIGQFVFLLLDYYLKYRTQQVSQRKNRS